MAAKIGELRWGIKSKVEKLRFYVGKSSDKNLLPMVFDLFLHSQKTGIPLDP